MLFTRRISNDEEEQLPVNTKVYANKEEFQGAFLSRSPFRITKTKNGQLFALYYGGDRKPLKHVMQRRIQRSIIEGSATSTMVCCIGNSA
jgi:hypothetical protein